ncbi:MAG TPA: hypothetical protein VGW12_13465 [Pyrinomonadaceae bacterium]|nr:hypothetical protein [Pyrinomonadaceae bacterium]
MIALFIIAFALLAATAYTLYRRRHASSDYPAQIGTPYPTPRSLFEPEGHTNESRRLTAEQTVRETAERKATLLRRAAEGDLAALAEAQRTEDSALYADTLNALLDWADTSEDNLRSLVAFIASDTNLRGNARLATAYMKLWREHPDRRHTAQMLHLAALSDDASAFERAVVAAIEAARAGRLKEIKREELSALVESDYWVLSSEARRTGAGFALKQRLAAAGDLWAAGTEPESPNVES